MKPGDQLDKNIRALGPKALIGSRHRIGGQVLSVVAVGSVIHEAKNPQTGDMGEYVEIQFEDGFWARYWIRGR